MREPVGSRLFFSRLFYVDPGTTARFSRFDDRNRNRITPMSSSPSANSSVGSTVREFCRNANVRSSQTVSCTKATGELPVTTQRVHDFAGGARSEQCVARLLGSVCRASWLVDRQMDEAGDGRNRTAATHSAGVKVHGPRFREGFKLFDLERRQVTRRPSRFLLAHSPTDVLKGCPS